jgi:hypothetical protein
VESLSPQPDRLYLVNSALGAGEFVGFNLRGDWFTEEGLLHTPPGWSDIPVWDVEKRRRAANWVESVPGWGELNWGFPTFYNAHKFRHHQNRDPKKAYGLVLGAFWDPRMRRVVLVSELLKSWCVERGAGDLYTRISQGEFPDTSMGARVPYDECFPAGTLVRTSSGYRPIESVQTGDLVVTKQGNQKEVRGTVAYPYSGNMITVKAAGVPALTSTAGHPYFVLRREQLRSCHGSVNGATRRHAPDSSGNCGCCGASLGEIQQVNAEDIRVGDYVLSPVASPERTDVIGTDLAYLAGVYAGDGCPIRQRRGRDRDGDYALQGIAVSCGDDDWHIERLLDVLTRSAKNAPHVYAETGGKRAISVRAYDRDLAQFLLSEVGEGSHTKRLRRGVLSTEEERLSFLGGLVDSDGHYNKKKGDIRVITVSKQLAFDTWQTCLCSGIPATVTEGIGGGGFATKTRIWTVFLPASAAETLRPYSCKVRKTEKQWASPQSFFWKGYLCMPVKWVAQEDVIDLPVFNLSVADDETYVAGGLAVHNCSICGNLARTPDRYCTHVHKNAMPPYGMRSILPDGRMCGVYNTHPRFFDDSYVFVGAEKSAKVMSNMTHRVRGERVYNQQLFPHVPALAKTAEWGDAHQNAPWGAMGAESPIQQKEQALNAAAKDIFAVPAPDDTLEQKLSRMLSGLPLTYGLDREILRFLHDQEKGRGRTKTGRLSEKDFQVWQAMELKKLREAGVTPEDILRVQQSVKAKIGDLASKTASTTKWAEILKTIPAQPENLSSIRKHERCLPDLPCDGASGRHPSAPRISVRDASRFVPRRSPVLPQPEQGVRTRACRYRYGTEVFCGRAASRGDVDLHCLLVGWTPRAAVLCPLRDPRSHLS